MALRRNVTTSRGHISHAVPRQSLRCKPQWALPPTQVEAAFNHFLFGAAEDIQVEAMTQMPLSNLATCIEEYGFPSDVLKSTDVESKQGLAACLFTPETSPDEELERLHRGRYLATAYSLEFIDERYGRLLQAVRRQRKGVK